MFVENFRENLSELLDTSIPGRNEYQKWSDEKEETLEQHIYRLEDMFEDEYNRVRRKPPLLEALLTEAMEKGVRETTVPPRCVELTTKRSPQDTSKRTRTLESNVSFTET